MREKPVAPRQAKLNSATGLEPQDATDASNYSIESWGDLRDSSAVNALHATGLDRHSLSSLDSDLQTVTAAWTQLPDAVRQTILALAQIGN